MTAAMSMYSFSGSESSSHEGGLALAKRSQFIPGSHPMMKAVELLEALREVDPELPAHTALCFLYVYLGEETGRTVSQTFLAEQLGMTSATASRNISILSEEKGFNLPGLGLVDVKIDPRDKRYRVLTLTAKGKKLARKLQGIIET